jgi:hypothetical protein
VLEGSQWSIIGEDGNHAGGDDLLITGDKSQPVDARRRYQDAIGWVVLMEFETGAFERYVRCDRSLAQRNLPQG